MRRFRRARHRQQWGWWRWVVLTALLLVVTIKLMDAVLVNPLAAVAENEARARAVAAVNRVIMPQVALSLGNEQLVEFTKDETGRVAAYNINTRLVNHVAAQAAQAVQAELSEAADASFGVPMGALTGSSLLATRGPSIPVKMMPIGTVQLDVQQQFQSEGINQTRHAVRLHATASVRVILPFVSREVQIVTDMPLSETVIVGPVPNSFYGGSLGNVSLPLQP